MTSPTSRYAPSYASTSSTAASSAWAGQDYLDANQSHQTLNVTPRSVAELVQQAEYVFDPTPTLQAYLRGLEDLRRQASVYEDEGDLETAFVMYMRCARLAVSHIPQHPDFRRLGRGDVIIEKTLIKTSDFAMERLKQIKPILKERYQTYIESQVDEIDEAVRSFSVGEDVIPHDELLETSSDYPSRDGGSSLVRRKRDKFLGRPKYARSPRSSSLTSTDSVPAVRHTTTSIMSPSRHSRDLDSSFGGTDSSMNANSEDMTEHNSLRNDASSSRYSSDATSSLATSRRVNPPDSIHETDDGADAPKAMHWTVPDEARPCLRPSLSSRRSVSSGNRPVPSIPATSYYASPFYTPFAIPYAPPDRRQNYVDVAKKDGSAIPTLPKMTSNDKPRTNLPYPIPQIPGPSQGHPIVPARYKGPYGHPQSNGQAPAVMEIRTPFLERYETFSYKAAHPLQSELSFSSSLGFHGDHTDPRKITSPPTIQHGSSNGPPVARALAAANHRMAPHLYPAPPSRPAKVPLPATSDRWAPTIRSVHNAIGIGTHQERPPLQQLRAPPQVAVQSKPAPKPAFTEGGIRLRPVLLPSGLVDTFAGIAYPNTRRDIETCGLILGKLAKNVLTATVLMIPKQTGTSDTCSAEHEEDILEVAGNTNTIVMGWIHTHPNHPLFLSSLDLHTHCSYQTMLPEAIAVVLAPTAQRKVGIFRCTQPPGLEVILQCQNKHPFHAHPDLPLYTDADDMHVVIQDGLPLDVVDVRLNA